VFASGAGSNALALLQAGRELAPAVALPLLVCDQPTAPVLGKLEDFAVEAALIVRDIDKKTHEDNILERLREARIDWIFLAGYMRLLSSAFVQQWQRWHGGAQ